MRYTQFLVTLLLSGRRYLNVLVSQLLLAIICGLVLEDVDPMTFRGVS